jgi:hypothetical protein
MWVAYFFELFIYTVSQFFAIRPHKYTFSYYLRSLSTFLDGFLHEIFACFHGLFILIRVVFHTAFDIFKGILFIYCFSSIEKFLVMLLLESLNFIWPFQATVLVLFPNVPHYFKELAFYWRQLFIHLLK